MDLKRHKLAVLGATGGVITLGAAVLGGTVMAQTHGTGSGSSATPGAAQQQHQAREDQFLNDLARNLGVDRSKLDAALKTTQTQEIDAAVQSGQLTQAQGDQIKQAIASGMPHFGIGGFRGGPGGPGGHGPEIPANVRQAEQDAVSKALGGETAAQIRADLQSGKTPDQIAQAHGTTVQAVNSAVAAAVQPLLDQAVQAGTITATQEQAFLTDIKNGKGFGGGFRGPGGPGRGGPNGRGAATPSATQ